MANRRRNQFRTPSGRLRCKPLAHEIVRRCLVEGWTPTGYDIWKEYDDIETDQQMSNIKKEAKRFAQKECGKMWGYVPSLNQYLICPDGDSKTAYEMLDYSFRHFADSGRNTNVLVFAANDQQFVTTSTRETTTSELQQVIAQIATTATRLGISISDPE